MLCNKKNNNFIKKPTYSRHTLQHENNVNINRIHHNDTKLHPKTTRYIINKTTII